MHCCFSANQTDDDEFEVVPGSELVVTRLAYKNNSSKSVFGRVCVCGDDPSQRGRLVLVTAGVESSCGLRKR